MTRALLINPGDHHATLVEIDGQDLPGLQKLVGGWLEGVPLAGGMALINEEGKLQGLPVNETATLLAHDVGAIPPRDTINGPMVLVGVKPGGGTGDVPQALVEHVREGMDIEIREEGITP